MCQFSSVQLLRRAQLCNPMDCSTPGSLSITDSWSSLRLRPIESMMPSNHLILCRPLLLLPSSIFLSIRVFPMGSVPHIRWPKYWSFSPANEYSGLISFRIDWFDLFAVQGTLKSSLGPQFKSINYSVLFMSSLCLTLTPIHDY